MCRTRNKSIALVTCYTIMNLCGNDFCSIRLTLTYVIVHLPFVVYLLTNKTLQQHYVNLFLYTKPKILKMGDNIDLDKRKYLLYFGSVSAIFDHLHIYTHLFAL